MNGRRRTATLKHEPSSHPGRPLLHRARPALVAGRRAGLQSSSGEEHALCGVVSRTARLSRGPANARSSPGNGSGRTGATHDTHFAALSAAAIEELRAVGFEPADADAFGHPQALEHLAALRIDAADVAFVAF